MADTFDLVGFLVENKLTETGRAKTEARYHFGKTVLNEMMIKADETEEESDIFDSEGIEGIEAHDDEEFMSEETGLEEAGYTDDEDLYGDDDLDFSAGDSLVKALGGKKSKEAFNQTNDMNFDEPDEEPSAPADDFEDPEDIEDVPAASENNLASQLRYDPAGIEFMMDDEELEEYLNSFRRPQVALKTLQRAIDQAQAEANDGTTKKFYLILENGFYRTDRFRRGKVIAIVRKTN